MSKRVILMVILALSFLGFKNLYAAPGEKFFQFIKGPLLRSALIGGVPFALCEVTERQVKKLPGGNNRDNTTPFFLITSTTSASFFLAQEASSEYFSLRAAQGMTRFFSGLSAISATPAVVMTVANLCQLADYHLNPKRPFSN